MSAADLHSRVTALLGGEGGIADAETLLADLGSEKAALEADRTDTHAQSVDVATTAAQAAKLHAKVSQLAFEVERLGRQESAVLERLVALRQKQLDAEAESERVAALAERDELASDFEHGYAEHAAAIVDLFDRVKASNARLQRIGLNPDHVGAEAIARGFCPNVGGKPGTLASVTRVGLVHDASWEVLWPRREPTHVWSPPPPATYHSKAPAARQAPTDRLSSGRSTRPSPTPSKRTPRTAAGRASRSTSRLAASPCDPHAPPLPSAAVHRRRGLLCAPWGHSAGAPNNSREPAVVRRGRRGRRPCTPEGEPQWLTPPS